MKSKKLIEVITLLSESDYNFKVEFIGNNIALVDLFEDETFLVIENEVITKKNFITKERSEININQIIK